MSKRVLVRHRDGQKEIALMEGSRLLAFSREMNGVRAEQIYLCQVDRIVQGMEAAFVKLGKDQTGFLPFSECEEKPRSGGRLLLQVKKPPIGEKAPYMTADIALAGRHVILTPVSSACAVSKKITDETIRAFLLNAAHRIAPEGMGVIMRTEAPNAPENVLAEEIQALVEKWQSILQKAAAAPAPGLMEDGQDGLARLLRDEHGAIEEILTDEADAAPYPGIPVRFAPHPFDLYGVPGKLEKSMQRKVWLDCGGYLIIDKTEALTVIDVNSGKYAGSKSGAESTFLHLNLEAAKEIARLVRLRALGGIILVDFVDMLTDASRQAVTDALSAALRDDPVKTVIHGFTHLGLMEMTRKKTENPQ
ncbi:MAG: ribonuclease E/G [Clostridia bacterium]|nr:ribonuclease E/G [Clostridia bacterium]